MNIGDTVGYSAAWVQSVQADYETASRKGTLLSRSGKYATVAWDDGPVGRVLEANLAVPGSARYVHGGRYADGHLPDLNSKSPHIGDT